MLQVGDRVVFNAQCIKYTPSYKDEAGTVEGIAEDSYFGTLCLIQWDNPKKVTCRRWSARNIELAEPLLEVGDRVTFTEKAKATFGTGDVVGVLRELRTEQYNRDGYRLAVVDWEDGNEMSREWDSVWLEKASPVLKPFFIVWNPSGKEGVQDKSYGPVFAQHQAHDLAKQYPGEDFFVCEMKTRVRAEVTPPTVTQAG